MKELNLTVTVDETNLILEALGNLPFTKVYALISKIQAQASQQLSSDALPATENDGNHAAPVVEE